MNAVARPAITIAAFESGDIDPGSFDHEAHVYVGWQYVRKYPLGEAVSRFTGALRRLTARLRVPDKYHDTISWFYLLLIAERSIDAGDDWNTFRRDNDDLFSRDNNILDRYYSRELLESERARNSFVLPDRCAE